MCDDAALKLLVQIAIHSASQENDYTLVLIIDIGLKDQTAIVKIGASRTAGDDAPNVQRSAVRLSELFPGRQSSLSAPACPCHEF